MKVVPGKNIVQQRSYQFILLFGVVSMFGDITYEGGRSISGPYLHHLGASAAMVGLVAGLGEFVGYAFRLLSGYLSDRTRAYWLITFIGYGLLFSVPLLAFTTHWQVAALFVILERFGKAVRSPAKDAMLSHATKNVGWGFGFGLHEAIDQIGGIIGPLIFSTVFFLNGDYRLGFILLAIPAALTIIFLFLARIKVPEPEALEEVSDNETQVLPNRKLSPVFWWYMSFAFLSVAGFANFQLIGFHFKTHKVLSDMEIPMFYAIAMGIDAIAALIVGKAFDKIGLRVLIALPLLTVPVSYFAFGTSLGFSFTAVVLWGIVMAIHETIMRAAIAQLVPINRRGFAYGIFNASYGFAWFVGGLVMGLLYERGIGYILLFTIISEVLAFAAFYGMFRKQKDSEPSTI